MSEEVVLLSGGDVLVTQASPPDVVVVMNGDKGDQGPQGETGLGFPAGGTTGQWLLKASDDDYDIVWADATLAVWGTIGGTLGDQTDLQGELDGKADTGHNHAGVYEPANANIQSHIASTANPHTVTAAQAGAYTTGQVDTLLDGKADDPHSHVIADVTSLQTQLDARPVENGFVDISQSTVSWSDATRTLTIQPVSGSYTVWAGGTEFIKSGIETAQITDTEGLWYFYFDTGGVLQATTTFTDTILTTYAFVQVLRWDATDDVAIYRGEERHGRSMPAAVHLYLHHTHGSQLDLPIGLALTSLVADGSGNSNASAQFGYSAGAIWDEDIKHTIAAVVSPAHIPIFYQLGASGTWRRKTANDYPIIYANPGTRASYNQFTGGAWQLTEVTSNNFVLVHYFATNDATQPVIGILGQAEYATIATATTGAKNELYSLVTTGVPALEFVPIATVIFETANSYSNVPKSRVRATNDNLSYVDWRKLL